MRAFQDQFNAMNNRFDAINNRFDDAKLDTNTQFDKFIAKLDNYKAKEYTNTATDNIVGDNRLLDDHG